MNQPLPAPAEAWLRALAHELWPLASDERTSVIVELRGHLAARVEAGALDACLAELGPAKAFAAAYDLPGACAGAIAQVPPGIGGGAPRKTVRTLLRDTRATMRASRNGLMPIGALLVTTLTATDFLLWVAARLPYVGIAVAPLMVVRVAAVLLALSATYRLALSRTERPWRVDGGFLRFAGALAFAMCLVVTAAVAAGRAAGALAHGSDAGPVRSGAALAALALGSIALLRVQPWLAALAARRQDAGLASAWRGTRGKMTTIAGSWALLVLPVYLLHVLLNLLALRILPFDAGGMLALAGLDGLASAVLVLAAAFLNAAVLRWILDEPVPAPSPFATEMPAAELVDAARARLDRLLQAQPVRAA